MAGQPVAELATDRSPVAMTIKKLLVANRGEIARPHRAGRKRARHCDGAGPQRRRRRYRAPCSWPTRRSISARRTPSKSYLNIDAILAAAGSTGADAIHPGYGFLAENAAFADRVEAAGLTFVGPRGDTIRLMGDKAAAREVATAAGVPTVPGSDGRVDDLDAARASWPAEIGFPVMIKAAAGGGGRGIRIAHDLAEFETAVPAGERRGATPRSATAASIVEKVIERARHIEVQVLGDGEDVVHCFERECSIQRRRQKVWEEAPSVGLAARSARGTCAAPPSRSRRVGELQGRRHARIPLRRGNRRLLLHRDEHPHPGRASGHRDGSPAIDLVGEMIADRRRRAAALRPGRHPHAGPRDRGAAQRGGPCQRLHAVPRHVSANWRLPDGPGVRFDHDALSRLCHPAVLRLPARQADRLGRGPHTGACARLESRARRAEISRGCRPPRRLFKRAARRGRRARGDTFIPAGWSTGWRTIPQRHPTRKEATR